MKKFLTMLLVGIMSSVLLTTPAVAYSSSEMPNALLLFVGTNSSYSWSPYPSYSNNDLDKILDATKEFVIINSNAHITIIKRMELQLKSFLIQV